MTKANNFRKKAKAAGKRADESQSLQRAISQRKRQKGLLQLAANEDWLDGKPRRSPRPDGEPTRPPAPAADRAAAAQPTSVMKSRRLIPTPSRDKVHLDFRR